MAPETKDDGFLSEAAKAGLAGSRRGDGGPFGAVIVRNGRVIVRAWNRVLKTKDPTAHAEVTAIREAARKLKRFSLDDCEIYSSTEPCPMCFAAIHWARISRVVYATTIADVKRLGFNELTVSNRTLAKLGKSPVRIARRANRDCIALLRDWARHPGRTY